MIKIEPRVHPKGKIASRELIEIPKISGRAFKDLREKLGVSQVQLTMLTDISRQKIARIEREDVSSMNRVGDEEPYVPRALVLALMMIEEGMLDA